MLAYEVSVCLTCSSYRVSYIVPCSESSQEAESTSGNNAVALGSGAVVLEVANTEHEECHVEREEEEKEGHGGSEGAEQQKEGKDEPAHEEETEGVQESSLADIG